MGPEAQAPELPPTFAQEKDNPITAAREAVPTLHFGRRTPEELQQKDPPLGRASRREDELEVSAR